MNRFKIFVAILFVLFFSLLTTPLTYAGGGGVYARTTNTEDPHWNIVRVYFDQNLFTCQGIDVSLNFVEPKDGDVISGVDGDNSSTINGTNIEVVNGTEYVRCSTYAKVYAANLEWNRLLNISFKGPNLEGSRTIAISFGPKYDYSNIPLLPWEEGRGQSEQPISQPAVPVELPAVQALPNPVSPADQSSYLPENLELTILGQAPFDGAKGPMRHVYLKWIGTPYSGDVQFAVYTRADKDAPLRAPGWTSSGELSKGPSATIDLSADSDWYIKVEGCLAGTKKCVSTKSVFVPKLSNATSDVTNDVAIVTNPQGDDQRVDELNKKVENLQQQLEQSKKDQSILEKRFNDLLGFIKSLFPFFK